MYKKGNKYIQVVIDFYSRYCFAWPTSRIDSDTLKYEFFHKVICHVGVPTRLYSDNGPCYTGQKFRAFCAAFGIKQIYVKSNQLDWDEFIPAVAFALNVSDSYSMGYSPYMLVFGRNAITPPEAAYGALHDSVKPVTSHLLDIIKAQNDGAIRAYKNLEKVQEEMKKRHDRKVRPHNVVPGSIFYVKIHKLLEKETTKKLQPLYAGPYLVIEFPTRHTVRLRDLAKGKDLPRSVSVEQIKPISPALGARFLDRVMGVCDGASTDRNTVRPSGGNN